MFTLFDNKKNIYKNYQPLINQINFLENIFKFLTDEELKNKISNLTRNYFITQKLSDDILIQSFALTREASKRTLGLRHYDEQLIGGFVLNSGEIAEMKTGEGKTLVATLPATLNAITKKGVHIVTVNDYLAKRDAAWMGQIFKSLGLTVGLIESQTLTKNRKNSYSCDITYVTNSELGFDFLNDNLVTDLNQLVQRPFNYCIIDEIDSILIDESRTPLVISSRVPTDSVMYIQASEISKNLRKLIDYEIDEKTKNIILTEQGFNQIEKILGIPNIFDSQKPWLFHITNALRANNFYLKDVDYIVRNNQIYIIDEFTGRILSERRWNDGLHEAVEAKENIYVKNSSETLASITYQNFFTLYPKLSGMTGTAKTAEREFDNIFNLKVIVLPTHLPFKREDLPDRIYINEIFKWKAVVKECIALHTIGRPILIGTSTIEKSEVVSLLLKDFNIPHKLLNAKPENLKFESEIIAEAGCKKAITISTNMAGRGTDIILGGTLKYKPTKFLEFFIYENSHILSKKNKTFFLLKNLLKSLLKNFKKRAIKFSDLQFILSFCKIEFNELKILTTFFDVKNKFIKNSLEIFYHYTKINYCLKISLEIKDIYNLGGLFVIGTERHESRRIDNQLRGRAGRQGDPGSSRFFISLEDKIFRLYGDNKIKKILKTLNLENDNSHLESKLLTKSLDLSQERVENFYYEMRKNLYKYDEVLNEQRKIFYNTRFLVLKTPICKNWILYFGEYFIFNFISSIRKLNIEKKNKDFENELNIFKNLIGFSFNLNIKELPLLILFSLFSEQFWLTYEIKESLFEDKYLTDYKNFEKKYLLKTIDICWSEHLEKMSELRESIAWQVYAQKDPLTVYKEEAYSTFIETIKEIMNILILNLIVYDII
jgi:preprotein translocase subunit SecA